MAEEDQTDILRKLMSGFSGKTVKDGIESRDIQKKIKPTLTAAEKKRISNVATVFAEAQQAVQRQNQKDEKGETARSPAEKAEMQVKKTQEKKKAPKFPLLATLALGITAFAAWIADFIGPVAEFISKTLPKLFRPMSKIAGGFFKAIKGGKLLATLTKLGGTFGKKLLKFGRFIPFVGSLFNFGFAIDRFKKGEIIPGVFEIVSGLLNLTGVGAIPSMLIDGALLLYDFNKDKSEDKGVKPSGGKFNMWGKIKEYALGLPGIQNIVSLGKGVNAVVKGDWSDAGKYFLESIPVVGNVIYWLSKIGDGSVKDGFNIAGDFVKSIKDKFIGLFQSIINGLSNIDIGGVVGGAWSSVKGFITKRFDDVVIKDGKIIPISKKDDILAAQSGGVFETILNRVKSTVKGGYNILNEGTGGKLGSFLSEVGEFGKTALSIASKGSQSFLGIDNVVNEIKSSNVYLSQLVRLTAQMANNQQGGSAAPVIVQNPSNSDMSGSMSGPSYADARASFASSPYSMSPS